MTHPLNSRSQYTIYTSSQYTINTPTQYPMTHPLNAILWHPPTLFYSITDAGRAVCSPIPVVAPLLDYLYNTPNPPYPPTLFYQYPTLSCLLNPPTLSYPILCMTYSLSGRAVCSPIPVVGTLVDYLYNTVREWMLPDVCVIVHLYRTTAISGNNTRYWHMHVINARYQRILITLINTLSSPH